MSIHFLKSLDPCPLRTSLMSAREAAGENHSSNAIDGLVMVVMMMMMMMVREESASEYRA